MHPPRKPNPRITAATAPVLVLLVAPAITPAGTIRDDVPDSQYTSLAADPRYASVGKLTWSTSAGNYLGSGTLLSSTWILTAAHVVDNATISNMKFTIGGNVYTAAEWFPHESWTGDLRKGYDIGLIRLSAPIYSITPAARFTGSSELGLIGTSVGFGRTGTGLTGDPLPAGTKRAGNNVLDAYGAHLVTTGQPSDRYSDRIVLSDFDSPENSAAYNRPFSASFVPLPLEYLIAAGDSGGGTFVDVAGQPRLAAVHSFVQATDNTTDSSYGDAIGSTRVNQFNTWIDDSIGRHWTGNLGGNFNTPSNWSTGTVPDASDVVSFKTAGTYAMSFSAPTGSDRILARAGNVTLNLAGNAYSLTSTSAEGSLTVGKYSGNNATLTVAGGPLYTRDTLIAQLPGATGKLNLAAGAQWTSNGSVYVGGSTTAAGGTGTLTLAAGSDVSISGTLHAYAAGTVNYNGGSLSAANITLAAGGRLLVAQGAGVVLRAGSLSITGNSRLNLNDNDLVLDYTGTSPSDTIRQYLLSGRSGGTGGFWNGTGIVSSSAASDGTTAIAYAENSVLGLTDYLGTPVDSTSLILKYTWYGDANLDGAVTIDDYTLLDRGLSLSLTGWVNGDFNYDNVISAADYLLIDQAYAYQTGALSPTLLSTRAAQFGNDYAIQLAIVTIPEPTTTFFLTCAVALPLRNRRPRR